MEHLDLAAMFLLGLLGTGHCVGMCGPLVLALPTRAGALSAHLLYHLGRMLTYTTVGGLLGGLGSAFGAGSLGTLARIQVVFSLVAAILLLLFGLVRLGILPEPGWMSIASPAKLPGFSTVQRNVLVRGRHPSVFLFGLLLGLLPCGLSYGAFAMALGGGGVIAGGLLVLVFGLGTVPGLLLFGTTASSWARRHLRVSDLLAGMLMVGMATSLAVDALSALQ